MKKLRPLFIVVIISAMSVVAYGAKKEKEFRTEKEKQLHDEYLRRSINGPKPIPACKLCGKPFNGAPCSNKTCPNFRKR